MPRGAERHTRQGHWTANPAARGHAPYRHGITDVGPVLGGRHVLIARPCACTGLTHEHDPSVCPAEPTTPQEEP